VRSPTRSRPERSSSRNTPERLWGTVWCNAAGSGRRSHFEPGGGGVFAPWPNLGGAFGVGWPPPLNYSNAFQLLDVDLDGDLDIFHLVETAPDTWTVFLSRTL
jgi:hypothetical protein